MTTISDRLTAAADRLEALDTTATKGPWRVEERHSSDVSGEGWSVIEVRNADGKAIAEAFWDDVDLDEQGRPNADLIAALRPLAPVVVAQLRQAAGQGTDEVRVVSAPGGTQIEVHGLIGDRSGCRRDIAIDGARLRDEDDDERCRCFDAGLAIADTILEGA